MAVCQCKQPVSCLKCGKPFTAYRTRELWRTELAHAAWLYKRARILRDKWIIDAVQAGPLTRQEIADAVGLAKSRVDQIAKPNPGKGTSV